MKLAEYKTTGNCRVWKILHKHYLRAKGLIHCTYCKYHRGENRTRKSPRGYR